MIFMKYELSSNINLMCLKSPKGLLTAEQTFDLLEKLNLGHFPYEMILFLFLYFKNPVSK